MYDSYLLNEKNPQLSPTGLFCTLTSSYSITLPKPIRDILNLNPGDEIVISLRSQSHELVVQKFGGNSLENIMILNERGSFRVPKEFIKFLYLEKGDTFILYLNREQKIVLLRKRS
ncbi:MULTISPECIES: AbrB/MazE/SpoVT family DNA-binding domain-containing protein [Oceanobacillus]|uniref:AbrB/MazE/SpoVT family DNA-binding domain-containing protein n=1 Tax=Oceanobacillus TaxID=182709 RepID=UPI000788C978|nr:AbrB/MazE/SpoVT family DNA-binding domain-containing protein [Oceanobacillus sojae]MCT1903515.1 AbrB/MazE/SpoVT family DNA-binding domain-containing protein [Oceanobacillus sojae]